MAILTAPQLHRELTLPSRPGRGMETTWPWPCLGCGGPLIRRVTGRTPYHCSDKCRSAAWRDRARGRSGPELARLRAARRAARAQEPPRLTPGEQGVIRSAWLAALVGYCAGDPGRYELLDGLDEEVAAAIWPEPFARVAAAGLWPGDEGTDGVIEAVVSERMKLARLGSLRARKADPRVRRGVTA